MSVCDMSMNCTADSTFTKLKKTEKIINLGSLSKVILNIDSKVMLSLESICSNSRNTTILPRT